MNIGSVEGGSWCERESHAEADEEAAKMGWTFGNNERGAVEEESGFA